MTINALNAMALPAFVEAVGWAFEHSPWVAERAFQWRPFSSIESLHSALAQQVEHASHEEQLALLRAHPDLGAGAALSAASASEQQGAGLDRMSQQEYTLFTERNENYKSKFGFPFLYAVKGATKQQILDAMQARLQSEPEEEFTEALRQVYRIAAFRLGDENGTVRQRLEK